MGISITNRPCERTAYYGEQRNTIQTNTKVNTPPACYTQDEVTISQMTRDTFEKEGERVDAVAAIDAVSKEQVDGSTATTFTSFATEFSKITEGYTDTIWEHYAKEHEENLTYDNPSTHIWDKYKNPDSPDFRTDLSEDERAWAYDQELDMLNGGKHLQISNPFVFISAGGPPTLSSAAMQANQLCRTQFDDSIHALFSECGIDIPKDESFRLTVDESNFSIHVIGLENEELTEAIEHALNRGDNGKNLYQHLKLTTPDGKELGVNYTDGHLEAVNSHQKIDDSVTSELNKQAGPSWGRYSSAYNPHQEAMNSEILKLNPDSPLNTQERMDRVSAAVRVGAPEIVAEFRTRQHDMSLIINKNRDIDPDGSIALKTYVRAYAQPAIQARKAISEYYSEAHKENSSYPFIQGLEHIAQKYKRPGSAIFRDDLPKEQRDMYYRQERALLTGARVTLFDPYALAAMGGIQTAQDSHQFAMQEVQQKMDDLRKQLAG